MNIGGGLFLASLSFTFFCVIIFDTMTIVLYFLCYTFWVILSYNLPFLKEIDFFIHNDSWTRCIVYTCYDHRCNTYPRTYTLLSFV